MSRSRKNKKPPKRVLALPDLEQAKSAVLNTLTSESGQRTYDHAITEFVGWYRSEPRLAFNRTVVLRYRIYLEQQQYAPTTNRAVPTFRSQHASPSSSPRTRRHSGSRPFPTLRRSSGWLETACLRQDLQRRSNCRWKS